MNKKLFISLLCALIISSVSYLYFSPQSINKSYDAFIYSDNTDFTVKSIIEIEGFLNKKILSSNTIEANVNVDDYSYQVILKQTSDDNYLGYIPNETESNEFDKLIGSIMLSKNMTQVWINLDDLNNRYKDIYYAIAPANNRLEAELILEKLVSNN